MENLKIVEYYDKRHHDGFKTINQQWISELFVIEPFDIWWGSKNSLCQIFEFYSSTD